MGVSDESVRVSDERLEERRLRCTQEDVGTFAQTPRQVGVEEISDLCDDWITHEAQLLALRLALAGAREALELAAWMMENKVRHDRYQGAAKKIRELAGRVK